MNDLLIHGQHLASPFLVTLDLLRTFVFALSGAAAGVKNKLDLFGLIVLAFATGRAGGLLVTCLSVPFHLQPRAATSNECLPKAKDPNTIR